MYMWVSPVISEVDYLCGYCLACDVRRDVRGPSTWHSSLYPSAKLYYLVQVVVATLLRALHPAEGRDF